MTRPVIQLLGIAGLIPFVAAALLVFLDSQYATLMRSLGEAYAFGIICFLCGSWWGMVLNSGPRWTLVLSNAYMLIAFFVFMLARDWWPLAAAILLMSILVTELNGAKFPALANHYRKLRSILSMVASASMLTLHMAA